MQVVFLTSVAFPTSSYDYGEVAVVPDEQAREWISLGYCEELISVPEVAALSGAPETAMVTRKRVRR